VKVVLVIVIKSLSGVPLSVGWKLTSRSSSDGYAVRRKHESETYLVCTTGVFI